VDHGLSLAYHDAEDAASGVISDHETRQAAGQASRIMRQTVTERRALAESGDAQPADDWPVRLVRAVRRRHHDPEAETPQTGCTRPVTADVPRVSPYREREEAITVPAARPRPPGGGPAPGSPGDRVAAPGTARFRIGAIPPVMDRGH
jgi:hypothetical protein